MQQNLSDLDCFKTGCIARLTSHGPLRRRLMDLGFVPGAEVTPLFSGSRGGIRAYAVGGSVIAMRRSTAEEILLKA